MRTPALPLLCMAAALAAVALPATAVGPASVAKADRLVLPGVGAFAACGRKP